MPISLEEESSQAIWINPDISSYSPAAIKPSRLAAASLTQDTNASVTGESASAAASTSPAPEPAKSRFHDVREDRDRIVDRSGRYQPDSHRHGRQRIAIGLAKTASLHPRTGCILHDDRHIGRIV